MKRPKSYTAAQQSSNYLCTSSDPLNDSITCARYVTFRNYERSYEIKAEVGGPELLELNALSIFILCKGVLAFF
jgi:hypothetical protein